MVATGARPVTVLVASDRQRDEAAGDHLGSGRAAELSFAEYTISIPPDHRAGKIEWPGRVPDARTDFVTLRHRVLDRRSFEVRAGERHGPGKTHVAVFVHGYNTNFQEAVFRLAQMTADADGDAVPILFAWPSDGAVGGYVADKDAATASRDHLVALLTSLAGNERIGRITLVGHSMGGWLTAEAVRQLRLTGKADLILRLEVVLAAPDIDVDVFRAQMKVIGSLDPPLTVLVSSDDKALYISRLLAGDRLRLGQLDVTDPVVQAATREANISVVDISRLEGDDPFKHDRFAALAAYYPKLADQTSADGKRLRQVGAFVFNGIGTTVASPFVLIGKNAFGE